MITLNNIEHYMLKKKCSKQGENRRPQGLMECLFITKWILQNISGTGGRDGSLTRDIMDDLLLVPTRNVHHSEKYKHVIEALEKSAEITRLVGHSLASAVIRSIKNNLIDLLQQPMLPLQ